MICNLDFRGPQNIHILISNTDDHLRNHGFLYAGANGWHLAPAYDLNRVPTDIKPHALATAIDPDDGTVAMSVAAHGVSASPLAGRYGRYSADRLPHPRPEHTSAPEIATRPLAGRRPVRLAGPHEDPLADTGGQGAG